MHVKDMMTRDVMTLRPDDTLHTALKLFTGKGISGAPVTKNGKLVGIITELDVLKVIDICSPNVHFTSMPHFFLVLAGLRSKDRAAEVKKKVMDAEKLRIEDFMTREPVVIQGSADSLDAARMMDTYKVNRLPVVESGKLIGIVTRSDIIRAVARLEGKRRAPKKPKARPRK
ncbi:MAG: CBS domain-containing protein [Candidatus Aenigmatarchaeota archaeon]